MIINYSVGHDYVDHYLGRHYLVDYYSKIKRFGKTLFKRLFDDNLVKMEALGDMEVTIEKQSEFYS